MEAQGTPAINQAINEEGSSANGGIWEDVQTPAPNWTLVQKRKKVAQGKAGEKTALRKKQPQPHIIRVGDAMLTAATTTTTPRQPLEDIPEPQAPLRVTKITNRRKAKLSTRLIKAQYQRSISEHNNTATGTSDKDNGEDSDADTATATESSRRSGRVRQSSSKLIEGSTSETQ